METEQPGHLRLTPPNSRGDLTLSQTGCGSGSDRLGEQLSRLCMELIRCLGIGFKPAHQVGCVDHIANAISPAPPAYRTRGPSGLRLK